MEAADIFEETPHFLHVRDAPSRNLMGGHVLEPLCGGLGYESSRSA